MEEIFKDVPNYEGYQVSNFGRVKSVKFSKEKILKPYNSFGYLICVLCKNGKTKVFRVHQLVAMAFLGHVPTKYKIVVNHKNLNPLDNRLENLELITHRENTNKKHLSSTSNFTGVYWYKEAKKWRAQIYINGKLKHLGLFDCELKASEAYQNKLKQIK
jgi:hypothetical protein